MRGISMNYRLNNHVFMCGYGCFAPPRIDAAQGLGRSKAVKLAEKLLKRLRRATWPTELLNHRHTSFNAYIIYHHQMRIFVLVCVSIRTCMCIVFFIERERDLWVDLVLNNFIIIRSTSDLLYPQCGGAATTKGCGSTWAIYRVLTFREPVRVLTMHWLVPWERYSKYVNFMSI